eukprot:1932567-Pyramimonas_sp.AAC.1
MFWSTVSAAVLHQQSKSRSQKRGQLAIPAPTASYWSILLEALGAGHDGMVGQVLAAAARADQPDVT